MALPCSDRMELNALNDRGSSAAITRMPRNDRPGETLPLKQPMTPTPLRLRPYSVGRDRRSDHRAGDADAHRPSSLRDCHAVPLRGHTLARAHALERVPRNGAASYTDRGLSPIPRAYAHRHDRHACGANAHHADNPRVRCDALAYVRSWARERASG
jgi:hypothetical protein